MSDDTRELRHLASIKDVVTRLDAKVSVMGDGLVEIRKEIKEADLGVLHHRVTKLEESQKNIGEEVEKVKDMAASGTNMRGRAFTVASGAGGAGAIYGIIELVKLILNNGATP